MPSEIRHNHLNKFGKDRANLEDELDKANEENSEKAEPAELQKYKAKFLAIDLDGSGDLSPMELLKFLNAAGVKDGGAAWTEPKVKEKIIKKFGDANANALRYAGFLRFLLGDEMGRVLRLKMKFEKMAEAAAAPTSSRDFKSSEGGGSVKSMASNTGPAQTVSSHYHTKQSTSAAGSQEGSAPNKVAGGSVASRMAGLQIGMPGQMTGGPKPMSEIMFKKFDTDNSGSIDSKELQHLCFNMGYSLTDAELDLAMLTLDQDGNGTIELEEFKKWWARDDRWAALKLDEEALKTRQAASKVFLAFDTAKKGTLSKKDFTAFHKELLKNGLTNIQDEAAMIKELDKNDDGLVQFSEYITFLQKQGTIKVKTLLTDSRAKLPPRRN